MTLATKTTEPLGYRPKGSESTKKFLCQKNISQFNLQREEPYKREAFQFFDEATVAIIAAAQKTGSRFGGDLLQCQTCINRQWPSTELRRTHQ